MASSVFGITRADRRQGLHLIGQSGTGKSALMLGMLCQDIARGDGVTLIDPHGLLAERLAFIGCSGTLEDPNFSTLLAWMRGQLRGAEHSHYLLVREGETLSIPKQLLDEARVVPLRYGSKHTDVLPYIRSLAPKRSNKSSGTSSISESGHPPPSITPHNLPPLNPDFLGREEPLQELRLLLTTGQGPAVLIQAITGLGGIGKTQTALAYCYRHLADYRLVWWHRAETPTALTVDYTTLAGPLGLDPPVTDQKELVGQIRSALQNGESWLLVFDNVEDPELPRVYLPVTGGGHVLITSRRADWQGIAKPLRLEVMPENEALQLLTGRPDPEALPPAALAEAKALAQDLGHLPLALAQARAYMHETGRDLAGYRKLLQDARPQMLMKGRVGPDYPASVAKTWQISIEAATGACAAARPLLELLAFFAPDALPAVVLASDPGALPEGLREELERDEAIAALNRFSLITAAEGTIAVHRLVQAVTRDGFDAATAKARAAAAVRLVKAALPWPPWEHTNWLAMGALLPHTLATAETAERLEADLEAVAWVLNGTALYHSARATWVEAEPLLKRAIAIDEKALGPEHPGLAPVLNNLANLYQSTGRYDQAEPLYQRAIAIGEKTLGPEHPSLATRLNNLAELYRATGRYDQAEPLYQRAIAILDKSLPSDHPNLVAIRENYAILLDELGRGGEASEFRAQAEAIRQRREPPPSPSLP